LGEGESLKVILQRLMMMMMMRTGGATDSSIGRELKKLVKFKAHHYRGG